jgi:uncharacterized membrane protein
MARRRSEHGQALPLVAVVIALTGLVALGLGKIGSVVVARAEAQTAADAAALAGAAHGRPAAEALAAANGGGLTSWRAAGREVEVTVVVRGETARARARQDPP